MSLQAMKRHWRFGRLVMSAALLCIAAIVYYSWHGVSWKIQGKEMLGFDVQRGLVYTWTRDNEKHEVQAYDLWTGEQRKTVELEHAVKIGASVPDALERNYDWSWYLRLSPNKKELIAGNTWLDNLYIFELEKGRCVRRLPVPQSLGRDLLPLVAMDDKGTRIALKMPTSSKVVVLDAMENSTDSKPDGSRLKTRVLRLNHFEYQSEDLAMSDRHVAYLKDTKWHVRDLVKDQDYKLKFSSGAVPRFFDDGRLLVFTLSRMDHGAMPVRYRLKADGSWQDDPMTLGIAAAGCEFVGYCDRFLVTDFARLSEVDQPDWLPSAIMELGKGAIWVVPSAPPVAVLGCHEGRVITGVFL